MHHNNKGACQFGRFHQTIVETMAAKRGKPTASTRFFPMIRSKKPQQLKQKIDQITQRFIENSRLSQTDFNALLNFEHDLRPQFNISGIEEMAIIPSKLKAMKALLSTPMID